MRFFAHVRATSMLAHTFARDTRLFARNMSVFIRRWVIPFFFIGHVFSEHSNTVSTYTAQTSCRRNSLVHPNRSMFRDCPNSIPWNKKRQCRNFHLSEHFFVHSKTNNKYKFQVQILQIQVTNPSSLKVYTKSCKL